MSIYSTRFQGSKRRVLPWLLENIEKKVQPGATVFDAFSGSGIVSYALADKGYQTIAADRLLSSEIALRAFIGNKHSLRWQDIQNSFVPVSKKDPLFQTYRGIFFPDEELRWLLGAAAWGRTLRGDEQAAFFWALFQSSLAKRPYNLFHRSNLSMRTRSVKRSFGNARTWERPFGELMEKFLQEQASKRLPEATRSKFYNGDIASLPKKKCDLLYLDPPYIPQKGESIDYLDFYGFLDVLLQPGLQLDRSRLHIPLKHQRSHWESRQHFLSALQDISQMYSDTPLFLSYRSDGYPSLRQLRSALGPGTQTMKHSIHYALAKKSSAEVLLYRP